MSPSRDPELTRRHILEVTAEALRQQGYKDTSLADIIDKAGVSKGALYHHFSSKQALAYAVFDEVFVNEFLESWGQPVAGDDPIGGMIQWLETEAESMSLRDLQLGCPVHNLAVEMAAEDEGFRGKVVAMFREFERRMAAAISSAQDQGRVLPEVDPKEAAAFVVVVMQGAMHQGKFARDLHGFRAAVSGLVRYLNTIRR